MPSSEPTLEWAYLGRVPYTLADELQRRLRERLRRAQGAETLLLLEHPHVYTLGRNADRADILADAQWLRSRQAEVVGCDRGGKVTYHGPGQLVGYPIVDLNPDRCDIRRYVRDLLEVLVRTLAELGIEAVPRHRSEEIGVWVEGSKIASIGVHLSRWITTHGFALNVATDLSYFAAIVPCGLRGVQMTSVQALTGRPHELPRIAASCARHLGEILGRQVQEVEPASLISPWPIAS